MYVIRYVAGYVCHKVHYKLEKSSLDNKGDMVLLMLEFYCSELQEDDSEEWPNHVDRGGLWPLFTIIEHIVQTCPAYRGHWGVG